MLLDRSTDSVTIEGVEYQYEGLSGTFHLGPLDLYVPYGSLTFWVGGNGSGKSTLARVLARELRPHAGSILGTDGGVLYHHQALEENIFPTLRVSEHLRLAGANSDSQADLLSAFPELVGVSASYPDELSGGQLQLLAFSSLVLRRCRLYIFDELLNHLDQGIGYRVLEWIRSRLVRRDNAVIIISHDLVAAAHHADGVVVFDGGKVRQELARSDIGGDATKLLPLIALERGHILVNI